MKLHPSRTLEESILLLEQQRQSKSLSILEILEILSGKGRPIILILLALPFCQPIQLPGLSTPFGIIIGLIGFRLIINRKIWLPKKLLSKTINPSILHKITTKTLNIIKKSKKWVHPRLNWVCRNPVMEKVNAVMICLLGIMLALPLPIPLSNLTAAWSIFFIELGMLEDDGLFVLIGYGIFLLTAALFTFLGMTLSKAI
ncbi:MAG: exopolysaccharide biosynthesis protein [Chlamydiia bacterium]|nr:exopolysaccharide biosynthesis protein [Chlamydiia bacterium]